MSRSRSRGFRHLAAVGAVLAIFAAACTPPPASPTTTPKPPATTTTVAPPATTTTTTPPSGPKPVGAGNTGTWVLKFEDNFNGSSLDLSKWRPNWLGSSDTAVTPPINDFEESCYDPAMVSVSGGSLKLRAEQLSSTTAQCVLKEQDDGSRPRANYRSGVVQSDDHFNFSYGYMEARINLAGTTSRAHNWAAFWSTGQNWPMTGEIDVMETLEGDPMWTYHWGTRQNPQHHSTDDYGLVSPLNGWHTFAAKWEPGKITYYYDGVDVGTVSGSHVVCDPHFLILNYGLSTTDWVNTRIDVPSTMEIDYVRVWQRP